MQLSWEEGDEVVRFDVATRLWQYRVLEVRTEMGLEGESFIDLLRRPLDISKTYRS